MMRHIALRTTITALGSAAALALVLTACGGGGGSATSPSAQSAPTQATQPNENQTVNNFSGPSAKMTVSIKVPGRTPTSAAVKAQIKKLYGAFRTDSHLREMQNTAATPAMRALGTAIHNFAKQTETSTRKSPQYVPGATELMEIVVSDQANDTIYVDSSNNTCNTNSCTATINAPVGTNMNVTIYLYDGYCGFLIAAGTTSGVTVTLGNTTPVNLTLNGVVAHWMFTTTASLPFLEDPTGVQSFNVTVEATDWDYDIITSTTTPASYLIDSGFNQITGLNFSVQGGATDITTGQSFPLAPNPDLTFNAVAYNFAANNTEEGGTEPDIAAQEVSGSQLVPNLNTEGVTAGTDTGYFYMPINSTSLTWTNPNGYPVSTGDPQFASDGGSGNYTYFTLEFPLPNNSGTYTFGLNDTSSTVTNITITDNGSCGGVTSSYTPSLGVPTAYPLSPQITMGSSGATSSCAVYASDGSNTSELDIYTDSSSLTIQNKVRKH